MRSIRVRTDLRSCARRLARRGGALLSCAALLAMSACDRALPAPLATAHPDDPTPRRGGTFTVASFGDIRGIDPANLSDGLAPQILQSLFAGLVDYDEQGKIAPDAAESWTISEDGRTVRFVLRAGVRFHDGEELTADDVKRSVERALHPTAPNPYGTYFASLQGYEAFTTKGAEHLEGVRVDGRYVVTFLLAEPDAAFLPLLAMHMLRPVCRSAGDRYRDGWHACGAGPFKLPQGGWDRGRQVTLERHDGYFRAGLPHLDRVRFQFHAGVVGQRFKFMAGEQDLLRDFLTPDLLKMQADPRWQPYGGFEVEKQIGGVAMNTEMPPFDNIEIRRAVAAALDREQLRFVRAASLRPAGQPVPPGVEGHDPALAGQRLDLAAALEHMRRAGYPYDPTTKTGGYPHVIPFLVYGQSLDEALAQVEQQQLARIGIRIDIRVVNYPTFLALRGRRREVALGPGFWQQDYPEAGSFLEPLFHSRSINDSDSNNWAFYKNPRVDELVDRARREQNADRRKKIYGEAQAILCDEAPWAFTHSYRHFTAWQPYVHGFRPHPLWNLDVSRTWLDRVAGPVAARALFSHDAVAKLLGASSEARP